MKVRGRCFTVSHYFSNSPLSGARGIFLPCRFSQGKIPDNELEERIQSVFGDIFVYYIYFSITPCRAAQIPPDLLYFCKRFLLHVGKTPIDGTE